MRVPLAWKNLTHDWRRLLTAVAGIGFAVVLMFMQIGFKNALFDSTVQVLDKLDADLVLVARARYALPANQTFNVGRIYQARACEGVRAAYPFYIERPRAVWKQPGARGYPIRVLACDPTDPVLLIPELATYSEALKQPGAALYDEKNKSVYQPVEKGCHCWLAQQCKEKLPEKHCWTSQQWHPNSRKPGCYCPPGQRTPWNQWRDVTLAGRSVRLVGGFQLGTDFANDGNLFMNTTNFAKFFSSRFAGGDPLEVVDLGVVKLRRDADPQEVKTRLIERLPNDVAVLTKAEMVARERNFWQRSTPIGYIFTIGTLIGFLVGVVICYQIIHADIGDHLAEFATLKAMGYPNRYFVGFVLTESVYLSLLSFIPGVLISLGLYAALAHWTGLLMILNVPRAASVLLLTLAMCVVSGCLAMRKVLAADPAELF